MGLTGRVLSFGPAVNVMDFSYDISADSYRGARRDAYAFYTSSNSPSLPGDLATDENAKNWFTALTNPNLSKAIHAMHSDCGRRWSLDSLATVAGMSDLPLP